MKRKYLHIRNAAILMSVCIMGLFYSCESEYMLYSGDEYIQFGPEDKVVHNTSTDYRDTLKNYTFTYQGFDVTQDTLYFDLYAAGGPKDYDRPFSLVQVNVADTVNCVPGTHYIAFDDASVSDLYVLKAGAVHMLVPIVFLRDESLQDNTYALKIELVENEYFKLGDSSLLWRKAFVTDQLLKPSLWTGTLEKYYIGKYSVVKHRFLIDATGENWDDVMLATFTADMGSMNYWIAVGRKAIADYNREHPDDPLTDEDGELVSM